MITLKQYIQMYGPEVDIVGLTCVTNMCTKCKIDHSLENNLYACHAEGDRGNLFFNRSINEMMEWEIVK